jgi:sugar phosphate isomerase/epimerase
MTRTQPTRRLILKTVLFGAAGIALDAFAVDAQTAAVPASGSGAGELKVSLNAFSFGALLNNSIRHITPGVTLPELLDFCAKTGFDGIDATGYYFPGYPKTPGDEYVDQFKRKAAGLGIGISGTGVRNTFTTSDKSMRDADVQLVKDWVETAARMGAPVIRVFADTQIKGQTWQTVANGYTRQDVQKWMADALRECAEHAGRHGVIIGVQNHADFLRTGEQHMSLIKAVDSPWCGPIVDIGSYTTNDPYADIALVAPHAVNWQVKTSINGPSGLVATDLLKLMRIVRGSGYHGYLPIETLAPSGKPYDPFALVPGFLAKVREAIVQTG